MQIWILIGNIVGAVLADAPTIEALIGAKNWVGLAENLVVLVGQVVTSFQAKHEAAPSV